MKKFFNGVIAEIKKVQWPTPKELAGLAVFTIIICAIIAVIVLGLDVFFLGIRDYLLDL